MATEYFTIKLQVAIENLSVERVKNILSTFSCDINDDIETFIKHRAIEFSNKGIARTHLIIYESNDSFDLLGYYTLTNKILTIAPDGLSSSVKKRIERFGTFDDDSNMFSVPTPLIAQLGKNFSPELNSHITGDELLQIACDKVVDVQEEIGGRLVYIECAEKSKLIDFYSRNGFYVMERGQPSDKSLIQMIKFL